eukprot:TRINITY_DN4395_c0_g1_i1.p1 TRINITY_DN4395_c0_g1~~TRINITY_DN4395_c0_g1_i1.p1  ORF type:complete len:492 (-),score=84.70 TRINITY_DN4395_c0_g1_i1:151-1626(-)
MGNSHFREEKNEQIETLLETFKSSLSDVLVEYQGDLSLAEREQIIRRVKVKFLKQFKYIPSDAASFPLVLHDRKLHEAAFQAICNSIYSITEEDSVTIFSRLVISRIPLKDNMYNQLESLVAFSMLKTLHITDIQISTSHLFELIQMIIEHPTLQYIILNNVTKSTYKLCKLMSYCARHNEKIFSYNISHHNIEEDGAEVIYSTIKESPHILHFKYDAYSVSEKLQHKIDQALQKNIASFEVSIETDTRWETHVPIFYHGDSEDEEGLEKMQRFSPTVYKESHRFRTGYSEVIGRRPTMEDAIGVYGMINKDVNKDLFCVYDGHGGEEVARYCIKTSESIFSSLLLENSPEDSLTGLFATLDENVRGHAESVGATALAVYIDETTIYCANAGDTRCVLCRKGKAKRLSIDHKPKDEKERIIEEGGIVCDGRVGGILAISRAIGDHGLGDCVTPKPSITTLPLSKDDKFLILACDGVWDVLSDQEAVEYVSV